MERRPDRAPASPVAAAATSFLRTSVRLTMTRRFLAASCAPQPRATFSFAVGIQPLFTFDLGVAAPSSQGRGRSWQLGAPGDTERGDYKNFLSTRIARRGFTKFPPVSCTFRVESGQGELDRINNAPVLDLPGAKRREGRAVPGSAALSGVGPSVDSVRVVWSRGSHFSCGAGTAVERVRRGWLLRTRDTADHSVVRFSRMRAAGQLLAAATSTGPAFTSETDTRA
mgnify:CR=1 FL=1